MIDYTFEHSYLIGSEINIGDYWVDKMGDVIMCVGINPEDSSDSIFSLAGGEDDLMDLLDDDNDYYVFNGRDIALSNPSAKYKGNILKERI